MANPHFVERPIVRIPGLVLRFWPYIDLERVIALAPPAPRTEGDEPLRIITPVLVSIGPPLPTIEEDDEGSGVSTTNASSAPPGIASHSHRPRHVRRTCSAHELSQPSPLASLTPRELERILAELNPSAEVLEKAPQ